MFFVAKMFSCFRLSPKTFLANANRGEGGVIHGGVGKGINSLPRSVGSVGRREVWKRDVRHPLNAWPMGHGPADVLFVEN